MKALDLGITLPTIVPDEFYQENKRSQTYQLPPYRHQRKRKHCPTDSRKICESNTSTYTCSYVLA